MKNLIGLLFGIALGLVSGFWWSFSMANRDKDKIEQIWAEPKSKNICQTNIVNNGLDSWLADTNHSFGPKFAKRIFVMQLPTGKWHIRYLNDATNYVALFGDDIAFDSADEARRMLSINMDLQIKKAVSDAMENAFK